MWRGQRAVQEVSRGEFAEVKVNVHCAHVWYFSPVDLAIGQDRRKRGLGAFKNTIERAWLFNQGTIKCGFMASR
jgi:hypothetical protein